MKPIQVNDRYGNTYTIRDLATPLHSPKDSATKCTYIIEAVNKDREAVVHFVCNHSKEEWGKYFKDYFVPYDHPNFDEEFDKAFERMVKRGDNHKRW